MGVKTITISLEAYKALLREKRPGESFSDVILRILRGRGSIMDLAGTWRDVNEEDVENIYRDIRERWSKWRDLEE